jgi:hypothetical protein
MATGKKSSFWSSRHEVIRRMVETWRGPTRIRSASGVSSCYLGCSIAFGCMLPLTGYEALENLMAYLLSTFLASQKPV